MKASHRNRFVLFDLAREVSRHQSLEAAQRRAARLRLQHTRAKVQNMHPKPGEPRFWMLHPTGWRVA